MQSIKVSAAEELWSTDDLAAWERALADYPAVVASQRVKGLDELDQWYRDELPRAIAERTPPFIDRDELSNVVKWKMMRGEWRARNLTLARSNRADEIKAVAERAFALVPDPRAPLTELTKLAGVGAATASAVLAAYRGDLYPFLDELIGAAISELGEPRFTIPYYLRYADALRQRAASLGPAWTPQTVGMALWSASGGKPDVFGPQSGRGYR